MLWELEVLKSIYYITLFSVVLCDVFSNAECLSHITDWFDFRCCRYCCCFGFGENNRSAVKTPTGYRSFSAVPDKFSTTFD